MKLKAPVVAVGLTLAGGAAHAADEPVTISPIAAGYEITFTESGAKVAVEQDGVTTTLPYFSPNKLGTAGGQGVETFKITAEGLNSVSEGGSGAPGHLRLQGGSDQLVLALDAASKDAAKYDSEVLTIDDTTGEVTIRDLASGGGVTIGASGFHVWVEGWSTDVEVEGLGYDADGAWFLGVPDKVDLSFDADEAGAGAKLSVVDVSLSRLTVSGRTTATRFEGIRAKDVDVSGTHTGVVIDESLIQTLSADGVFTGAIVGGSMIGIYLGPGSFHAGEGIIKY